MSQPYPPLEKRPLPPALSLGSAFGVGAVALGLAIGSGELILWPHLVVQFGLGVLWGALLGIVVEYFINQEVARNALATGESFFLSLARSVPGIIFFWLFSAFLLYIWPGWAGAMGSILQSIVGWGSTTGWAWASLAIVFAFVGIGRSAYGTMERMAKITVPLFFTLLIATSFLTLTPAHFIELARGLASFGTIPEGMPLDTFLAAIVFAGAGGLLNVCISFWYRDKGYGLGAHVGKITNPITGSPQAVSASGFYFEPNIESLALWKRWMRLVRLDQGIFFAGLGMLGLLLLSLNAYAVLAPLGAHPEDVNIIAAQATIYGSLFGPFGSTAFLLIAYLELFSTLWIVLDVFTRIVSDIIYTNVRTGPFQKIFSPLKRASAHVLYYGFFTLLIVINAILLPFGQPFFFLVTSAVLGAAVMAVYIPFLLYMNNARLPRELRPSWLTNVVLVFATVFFAIFSVYILIGFFD